MKGIIIYNPLDESIRRVAAWVREDTGFDLFPSAHCPQSLAEYDIIVIIGGSRHSGALSIRQFIFQKVA